jgi:hypothetical protein
MVGRPRLHRTTVQRTLRDERAWGEQRQRQDGGE